jgi:tetratricopeptide (TPR) repeat protein
MANIFEHNGNDEQSLFYSNKTISVLAQCLPLDGSLLTLAHLRLARGIYTRCKNWPMVREHLDKASKCLSALRPLNNIFFVDIHIELGKVHFYEKDYERTLQEYSLAYSILTRCPKSDETSDRLHTLFCHYHDMYVEQGDLMQAIAYSKMALDVLYTSKIQALLSMNDEKSKILSQYFQRAACITCLLGTLYARLDNLNDAEVHLELSLKYINRFKGIDDSLFLIGGEDDETIPVNFMEGSINSALARVQYYLNRYCKAYDHALEAARLLPIDPSLDKALPIASISLVLSLSDDWSTLCTVFQEVLGYSVFYLFFISLRILNRSSASVCFKFVFGKCWILLLTAFIR